MYLSSVGISVPRYGASETLRILFREWATIQAGFYDEYQMPDGSRRRVAKSISFASMDDSQFNGVYKSVLNVLWNYILRRKFHSPAEAENAASQLLSFAGDGYAMSSRQSNGKRASSACRRAASAKGRSKTFRHPDPKDYTARLSIRSGSARESKEATCVNQQP